MFVATGTDYENSELVYQGSANNNYTMIGYVHRTRDTVQVELTKVQGNITVGQALVGDNSGVSRIVTQIARSILNQIQLKYYQLKALLCNFKSRWSSRRC